VAEVQEVVPGLYRVPLGVVDAYLLVDGAVTLVDTGTPGSEGKILAALRALGRGPSDVGAIVVTHCHADHSGSLAALEVEVAVFGHGAPIVGGAAGFRKRFGRL